MKKRKKERKNPRKFKKKKIMKDKIGKAHPTNSLT